MEKKTNKMAIDFLPEQKGDMYSKFEAQISREIADHDVVFKIVLLKIKIDDVEHWVFSTFFTALSETGETLSVKTFA